MFTIHANASEIPAAPPPPGMKPNYIDPPSHQPMIVILEAVFTPLMLLSVIVRVFVRTRLINLWGWEDMLMLGMGRHMWDVPMRFFADPDNVRIFSVNITYPWTVCFTKLSILLLYRRLFIVSRVKVAVWIGIIMTAVFYTTFIVIACASLVVCTRTGPHSGTPTFCRVGHNQLALWHSAVNVVTDFYVLLLPIAPLVRLQMSQGKEAGLSFVFASGFGACAASIARLIGIRENVHGKDMLWDSAEIAVYSIAEINIGVIIACVCTFPKFVEWLRELGISNTAGKASQRIVRFARDAWASMQIILPMPRRPSETVKTAPERQAEVVTVMYVHSV
ncbi:hypothetical protein BDW74DRAFT_176631 [Aspergillus multicolor]|uniref:uncharacterized protein n=1 Tax=Aspergillus multicolor TaxID=41759 RepID=UPI003CCD34AE